MSWYYFSGHTVKPIRVSSTKSVAVRPNTKVEILEIVQETQALINAGILRRTGRPKGATSIADLPPRPIVRMRDVIQKSPLATYFAEKGVTTSKEMPPQKPVGAPEYTLHEMELAERARSATPDEGDAAVLPAVSVDEAAEKGSGKSKRRRDQ
jgi:hypothetical protein